MRNVTSSVRSDYRQSNVGAQVGAQVAARPLLALAAAVTAGYMLGRIDSQEYGGAAQHATWNGYSGARQHRGPQSASDLFAPVRDEIELIQSAAITVAKQKLYELLPWGSDRSRRSGYIPRANQGLHDPNAERQYINTYHAPEEQQEI